MRKYFCLGLLIALCCSCNNEKEQIQQAAYGYSVAMANYDIDGAEPFCTEETSTTMLSTARYLLQFVDSSYIAADTPASIEIVSVKQMSDTTACAVFHKTTPIKDFSDTLELRKRDGKWLAHAPIIKNNAAAQ